MTTLGSLYGHSRRAVKHVASQVSMHVDPGASSQQVDGPQGSSSQTPPAVAPRPLLRHNVLMAGLRRSGKSSIIKVVHDHLSPSDTLFLESNSTGVKGRWTTKDLDGFLALRIWDGPGTSASMMSSSRGESGSQSPDADGIAVEIKEGKLRWTDVGTVIFVIDAQDDYFEAISRLQELILHAFAINPLVHFHVFVHKVDGLSDDYKFDTQRDIEQRLLDELSDASASFAFAPGAAEELAKAQAKELFGAASAAAVARGAGPDMGASLSGRSSAAGGASPANAFGSRSPAIPSSGGISPLETSVRLHFHLTSIFDNSIFVAMSKVQQSLLEQDVAQSLESGCDSVCGVSEVLSPLRNLTLTQDDTTAVLPI